MKTSLTCWWLGLGLLTLPAAHAHSPAAHSQHQGHTAASAAPSEQKDWGIAGDPKKVQRTLEIRMSDDMRFAPKAIQIKLGETVRLVAVNAGKQLHEIVIGTPQELKAHAEMMKKHPGMEHDEPYMAHVNAGQKGAIVWTRHDKFPNHPPPASTSVAGSGRRVGPHRF